MGTNYYLETGHCHECGKPKERKHIGKKSAGWVFCLAAFEDRPEGKTDIGAWVEAICHLDSKIRDEYGKLITKPDFLNILFHPKSGDKSLPRYEIAIDIQIGEFQ
jgi:hypothetical protein